MKANFQDQTFLNALHEKDLKKVEALLNEGFDLDFVDDRGDTLLLFAIKYLADGEIVRLLLQKGVQVDTTDKKGNSSLHYAVELMQDENVVREILGKTSDINVKNSCGQTVLHYGILKLASSSVIKMLLDKGADVKSLDDEGRTPLEYVQLYNPPLWGLFLLARGSKINVEDKDGNTPLMIALSWNQEQLAAELVSRGADINCKNKIGQTPLHIAACGAKVQFVKLLIEKGADVNSRNNDGKTPLDLAIMWCEEKIALKLLKEDTELDGVDDDENNILQRAIISNMSGKMIEKLLKNDVDIDHQNAKGETALHLCVKCKNSEAFVVLGKGGADLDVQDVEGNTALHLALKSYPHDDELDSLNFLEQLIVNGADLNLKNKIGETPLLLAASMDISVHFIKMFISHGADVKEIDSEKNSLLHLAARNNNEDLVKFLINHGVDVKSPNAKGETPLSIAANFCNETNILLLLPLLEKEAILNFKNESQDSLLHISLNRKMEKLFVRLLVMGPDLYYKDGRNKTPIDLAVLKKNKFYISKILEWGGMRVLNYLKNLNPRVKKEMDCLRVKFDEPLYLYNYKSKFTQLEGYQDISTIPVQPDSSPDSSPMFLQNVIPYEDAIHEPYEVTIRKPYEVECRQELLTIQSQKYGHNSLGDVFKQYNDPKYLSNKKLEEVLTDNNFEAFNKKYPIYGFMLRGTYFNAKIRKQLLDRAQETITVLFENYLPRWSPVLPYEVGRMISSCLNDVELEALLDVTSSNQSVGLEKPM